MADKKREAVQQGWMNDKFHVIVATIAFGMGIDKPDVRFVIHNSVPKSVEGFYQESGRGGRDGEVSYSYLYYSYSDIIRVQKLIQLDRNTPKKTLDGHFDMLQQMAQYCENHVDCRRYLQLLHLGEKFDRQLCIDNKDTTCDNCENMKNTQTVDVTKEAREIAVIVKELASGSYNFTMNHIVDVYSGSKKAKVLQHQHDKHRYYAAGAHLNKNNIHRILKDLSFKKVMADHCVYNGEFPTVYIKPGPNYNTLFKDNTKLTLSMAKTVKPLPKVSKSTDASTSSSSSLVDSNTFEVKNFKLQCHEDLLDACRQFALERNCTLSSIMNLTAIKVMSERLPSTKEDFMKIQYVTAANYEKFGETFLRITKKYYEQVTKMKPKKIEAPLHVTQDNYEERNDWAPQPRSYTYSPRKRGVKRKGGRGRSKTAYRRGGASKWKKRKKS